MERIAKLITASASLRRKIWASLPIQVRIGEFLVRLASTATDGFGKVMYAEFIQHGVVGMPDVHGKPAADLVGTKSLANRLPTGYGREFGTKVYKILINKYHNAQMVEDIMSDFVLIFLDGGSDNIKPGVNIKSAEQYVLTGTINRAINFLRKKREVSDSYGGDGDEGEEMRHETVVHPTEESAEQSLNRLLPKVSRQLKSIHPDAGLYVRLSILEGYRDAEIVGDVAKGQPSMLPHPYTASGLPLNNHNWTVLYKKRIYEVLKRGLGSAGISALV